MALNEFELAEAYVELTPHGLPQMRGALGSVKTDATTMAAALERASRNAKRFLLVGTGVTGLALKMAADTEQAAGKFRAVFGEQAKSTEQWADSTAKSLRLVKEDLIPLLSTFQDTFVPLGFASDKAAELSKQLTTLTQDMGAFYDEAEPEVANALTSALVGNHEAVRRYGIIITQATLDLKLLEMGLPKVTKGATEQQKVMARLAIIVGSTKAAHGAAAREIDTVSAQIKQLTSQMRALAREYGGAFLGVAKEVLPVLRDMAVAVGEWVKENKDAIPSIAKWSLGIAAFIAYGPNLISLLKTSAGLYRMLGNAMLFQAGAAKVSAVATGSMSNSLPEGVVRDAAGKLRHKATGRFVSAGEQAALGIGGGTLAAGGKAGGGVLAGAGGAVGLGALAALAAGAVALFAGMHKKEVEARERAIAALKDEAKWRELETNAKKSNTVSDLTAARQAEVSGIVSGGLGAIPDITTTIEQTAEEKAAAELAQRTQKEAAGIEAASNAWSELAERNVKIERKMASLRAEQEGATVERYGQIHDALVILEAEAKATADGMRQLEDGMATAEGAMLDRDEKERVAATRAANAAAPYGDQGNTIADRAANVAAQAFREMNRTGASGLQSMIQDMIVRKDQEALRLDQDRNRKLDDVVQGVGQVNKSVRQIQVGFG